LNARGIEAYPVLVNTVLKETLYTRLPAGNIFDHCVAVIVLDGKKIFIDPTISNQGGKIESYSFPDYRVGLVIDEDISGLDTIGRATTSSTSEIQTLEVMAIDGEAMLSVRTIYTGLEADYQRAYFARTPLETVHKSYLEYQANLYPDITKWDDLKYTDNRQDNVFTVEEKYKIPKLWKPYPNEEGKIYCTLQPLSLTTYFDIPKNIQQRTSPYYLTYPADFTHTLTVKLPEKSEIEPIDKVIENDLYQYEYTVKNDFHEITRMMHYSTKKDYVPVKQLSTFASDHASMYDDLVYQLVYNNNIASTQRHSWVGIAMVVLSVIGGGLLVFWLYNRYDPAPHRFMVRGTPIGGWLILLGIGVTFAPFRLLYDFATNVDSISGTYWLNMFGAKRYGMFAFFFLSQVYYVVYLMMSVLLIVLFYQRRSSFPKLMIIQMVAHALMIVADSIILYTTGDSPSAADFEQIVRPVIYTAIWTPYLLISEQVKETFVVRGPYYDDHADTDDRSEDKVHELSDASNEQSYQERP
jgi:hypothetical protein